MRLERFDAQIFFLRQRVMQLAVFLFQNGLFRHNGGGFGMKTRILRPEAVQAGQKLRNLRFKLLQKFHDF